MVATAHTPTIGLTGSIASGKSTVAHHLVALGAYLIDADTIARAVLMPGSDAYTAACQRFPQCVERDGTLNRSLLATHIFTNAKERAALEAITHPVIATTLWNAVERAQHNTNTECVIVDIPLLYERGYESLFDGVLLAHCSLATQRARLMTRDHLGGDEADRRIAAQMTLDSKRTMATWIISTEGTHDQCAHRVKAWWDQDRPKAP